MSAYAQPLATVLRYREHALATFPRVVASMLAVAALLAAIMAVLAPINHRPDLWRGPPDEYGHRAAARYYLDHWLPPKVGDPATLDSYSRDYGFSYINDTDPVYPLAGRFAALLSPVLANADLAMRLFNAALLAALAAICFARPGAALAFLPLVLTPQAWYIFSYFNNDAFPIFLAALLAWQVADPGSAFNRFLDAPRLRGGWGGALAFVVLAGMLALSKTNFLSFLALLPALVCVRRLGLGSAIALGLAAAGAATWYQGWFRIAITTAAWAGCLIALTVFAMMLARPDTRPERTRLLGRLALLAALALALVIPRYWWDAAINGSLEQKRAAQGELQQQIAKPEYKPNTIYGEKEKSYYGIELRARGTPLSELFSAKWRWHSLTFATATGSYGWIQFTAGEWYYALMLAGYAAIAAICAFAALRSREPAAIVAAALVAAFAALAVGIALFHSWNNDFQAQGRYLFPILGMLGAGLVLLERSLPRTALLAATACCFLLGLYSFVFIGLGHVPGSF